MSRRPRADSKPAAQLFPFLDALICTMGALLVLLHAFAQHGQDEVERKINSPEIQEARRQLQEEREDLEWRISQLKDSRERTEAQLTDERLKLSHVEDHQRRLLEKLDQLRIAAAELEKVAAGGARERQKTGAEIDAARQRVSRAKEDLADAQSQAAEAAKTYSVVPYEGPNTTRRRPIYIECRDEAIVLQPEGIELRPENFSGILGPGNPLAAAMRGMREYFARQTPGTNVSEPYPLLLVRPEGIVSYYAARAALESWGADFGYELIGSDWKLAFPDPDPQLAETTRRVVAEAALRMQELARATAHLNRNRSRPKYHAGTRGGFRAERGSQGGAGNGGSWDNLGDAWVKGDSSDADSLTGQRGDDGRFADAGFGPGTEQNGAGESRFAGPDEGGLRGQSNSPGGNFDSSYASQLGTGKFAGNGNKQSGTNRSTGQAPRGPGSQGADSPQFGAQNSGEAGQHTTQGAKGAAGGTSTGAMGGSSSGSANPSSAGGPSSPFSPSGKKQKTTSIAQTRGRDWGLSNASEQASATTRPIRVECYDDHLVIVPEDRQHAPQTIPLNADARANMDQLVDGVRQYMEGWGTAGRNLYWRPTLLVDVKPGAADRYAEIKALLADSGLDVRERQPPPTANGTQPQPRR